MNKIGIFGDSFGENIRLNDIKDSSSAKLLEYRSWIDLIGTTRSHALGGTDIQWSFLEFEKHHSKYDQVIFVLTNTNRVTIKDENTNKLFKLVAGTYAGEWSSDMQKDADDALKNNNIETHHMCKALMELEKVLLMNNDYQDRIYLFYNLVIERIKQIRPDIKFINGTCLITNQSIGGFHNSSNYPIPSIPLNNSCLQDITDYENKIMKWKSVDNQHDTRIGHLTEESHIILASLIKKWLKTDEMFFNFNLKEFENVKPDIRKYNNG